MMRLTGFLLLAVGMALITLHLVRFSSTVFASAREEGPHPYANHSREESLRRLSSGVVKAVKFLVIPASFILVAGVLLERTRRDERRPAHLLRAETEENE